MIARHPRRLCLFPRLSGRSGPSSFQARFIAELAVLGVDVTFDPADIPYDCLLVNGGTRHFGLLRHVRQQGVPVYQRLDGMNWIHRRRRTGVRHYLRAEANNLILRGIRRRFADGIIYQSQFSKTWWEGAAGTVPARAHVVLNGVPLDFYTPQGEEERPEGLVRILVVEGNLGGGYEIGLTWAFELAQAVHLRTGQKVELEIVGKTDRDPKIAQTIGGVERRWLGSVSPDVVPRLDRSAHMLFASDVHPACPNSVIEALACGLPVVSFGTGALPELVTGLSGRLADYGSDPWKVEPPDMDSLADAAIEVLDRQSSFRAGARARAEDGLGAPEMVRGYLSAFGWV